MGLLFERTDAVEINRVILDNLHRMKAHNFDIFDQPDTQLIHGDGIRFVRTVDRQYSLILNTVTSPLYFSSSKLYTADFFQHVRKKLTPDGVYITWVDGKLNDEGLDIILRSIDSAFDHCWLAYLRSGYFLLICSESPIAPRSAEGVIGNEQLDEFLQANYDIPSRLLPYLVLSPDAQAFRTSSTGLMNTLDFPALEHLMAESPSGGLDGLKEGLGRRLDLRQLDKAMEPFFDWDVNDFSLMSTLRLADSSSLKGRLTAALRRHPGITSESYAQAILRWAADLDSASGYYRAGRRLEDLAKFELAVDMLERSVQLDPLIPKANYRLGRSHAGAGRPLEALEAYLAELEHHGYDRALYRAGETLIELGRTDEVDRLLRETAPGQLRESPRLHYLRGSVAMEAGLREEALSEFRQAVQLDPTYTRAQGALNELLASLAATQTEAAAAR